MGRITSPVIHWKMLPWWSRSENSHWFPSGLNNAWEAFTCVSTFFLSLSQSFFFVAVVDLDRRTVIDFRLGSAMRGMCVRAIRVKVNILWLPSWAKNEHNLFLSILKQALSETEKEISMFHCSCICLCIWKLHMGILSCSNLDWNWHQF